MTPLVAPGDPGFRLLVGAAGLFGAIMGSAVTALAWRIPRGQSWVHGRSGCTSCGHALEPRDLIPIVSWLLARGRCRHCTATVSWRYPVTELVCALWAALLLTRTGVTWSYPLLAVWGFLLVALLWVDLDFQLLPDVLTLPGTLIASALGALESGHPMFLVGPRPYLQ